MSSAHISHSLISKLCFSMAILALPSLTAPGQTATPSGRVESVWRSLPRFTHFPFGQVA
jgi:hypothetical protein